MEGWWIAAAVGAIAVLVAVEALRRRHERRLEASMEKYYGPYPERESDENEERISRAAQSGQVTPGAVTPAAAGSSERYYQETGVGEGGPRHTAGPAEPTPTGLPSSQAQPNYPDESTQTGMTSRRAGLIGLVAGAGAGLGLAIFFALRRRARRRSKLDQLRSQARKVAGSVGGVATAARSRAADLADTVTDTVSDTVDTRTTAGGGLALAAGLALFALARRWLGERGRAAEARRRAEEAAAEAARKGGVRGLRIGVDWLNRLNGRVTTPVVVVRERLPGSVPSWTWLALSALGLLLAGLMIGRATRQGMDWTGVGEAESAPAGGG